ncbi:MAG: glutathione S-transferase family protein [Hyphomicrobiales bacterium]|nr:glutathione S-transferase family protein [Hyphomicrobiales bacterium]
MKLRYARTSPFVRKVVVFAEESNVAETIHKVDTDVWSADTDIHEDNPLGKIPALVTDDGTFVGSFACCDYLNKRWSTKKLIPENDAPRWRVMQIHGLADGAMEAAVAYVIEARRRPQEFVYADFLDRQMSRLDKTMNSLEARIGDLSELDLGSITTGCMLGYLDFRLSDQFDWRARAPQLADWYKEFSQRPSMQGSTPA